MPPSSSSSSAPSSAPAAPAAPGRHVARHGLIVLGFNFALWAFGLLLNPQARAGVSLVYTQAIGLSIWACIDIGRHLLKPDPRTAWLPPRKAVPLVAGGVLLGFLAGTALGDAYSGNNTWALWARSPRQMVTAVALTLLTSVVVTFFFTSRGRLRVQREQLDRAERDATLARLALLQSQLEPHMLFNTLANLRVLIGLDPPRAQAMLDRLIAFLRATLGASRTPAHALSAEFERLDDYLQLMAVRMGPRLAVRLELPEALRSLPVPPLLLQPLAENAIQHGLEPRVEGGRITVSAERVGHRLRLCVHDTGVGLAADPPSRGTRFGLQQVRDRLHTLYGNAATLSLAAAGADRGGGTLACIELPLDVPLPAPSNLHPAPPTPP
jgi:signal transduction histidine kinase